MTEENSAAGKPRREETRGQWCIKHAKMTKSLKALLDQAAERSGFGINEWACDALEREARRQLGMEPLPDTRESLMEIAERLDRLEKNLAPDPEPGPASGPGGLLGRFLGPKR